MADPRMNEGTALLARPMGSSINAPAGTGKSVAKDPERTLIDSSRAQQLGYDKGYGYEFAGWGTYTHVEHPHISDNVTHIDSAVHHKLGEWRATSICGNDITSSCLYVAGICAATAGKWTPISLALVAAVLYGFRTVYTEVGSALPLNGGTYTVLLNTTSKSVASLAACLSMLSYIATAVVSASSAMYYLNYLVTSVTGHNYNFVFPATIGLLGIFALLNLIGISESANVALAFFVFHLTTLMVLIIVCVVKFAGSQELLVQNWSTPVDVGCIPTPTNPCVSPNAATAIFQGYCSALLGISGFESSANYIEQQLPGVFPKTLRNMWIAVAFLNPVISFLSLCVLPINTLVNPLNSPNLLIVMAQYATKGTWLQVLVGLDATLVLSGAVLTGYVGVTGLIRRMALDRVLPQFLLAENKLRRTNHLIIIGFFLVCSSLYAIVGGNITVLGGVYTIAFLSVMALFALGNMMLKYKRGKLPTEARAAWPMVVFCFVMAITGLIGNILANSEVVFFFFVYFLSVVFVVVCMFMRIKIMKMIMYFGKRCGCLPERFFKRIEKAINDTNNQSVIFFSKDGDLPTINKAILYARDNELTTWFRVCMVVENESDIPASLYDHIKFLDEAYPKLRIDLVTVKGSFGPQVIEDLSMRLNVKKNFMFITCPSGAFPHNFAALGGVRVITN